MEAIAEKTRHTSPEQKSPLTRDTLKKGFDNINNNYSLLETIIFLNSLGKNVILLPNQSQNELFIKFPSPNIDNWREAWKNFAIITDIHNLLIVDVGRRGGPVKKMYFENFFATISFDKNTGIPKEVLLNTKLSPRDLRKKIEAAIDTVPQNWQFNPR